MGFCVTFQLVPPDESFASAKKVPSQVIELAAAIHGRLKVKLGEIGDRPNEDVQRSDQVSLGRPMPRGLTQIGMLS